MLMVLWSADTCEYLRSGVSKIIYTAVSGTQPGAIILMHDGGGDRSETVAACHESSSVSASATSAWSPSPDWSPTTRHQPTNPRPTPSQDDSDATHAAGHAQRSYTGSGSALAQAAPTIRHRADQRERASKRRAYASAHALAPPAVPGRRLRG